MTKLVRLAEARGESTEEVGRRFSSEQIERAPNFSKHIPALIKETGIEASGVEGDLAWVRLQSGRVFYSRCTHASLRRQYPYVEDRLPGAVREDTFLAAIDVVQRYITDFTWPPPDLVRQDGQANVVELGAYLGHKTIRFAEELASQGGKILAVEMIPDNCEILRRNISANGFHNVIDVMAVGVWNEATKMVGYTKGRQRNSLIPIDKLDDGGRFEAETRTLDQIIGAWGVGTVDLVFVTVNGVEIEVLEGFSANSSDVRAFFVAAPYVDKKHKVSNAARCREMLHSYGYTLIDVGNPNRVIARRDERPQ